MTYGSYIIRRERYQPYSSATSSASPSWSELSPSPSLFDGGSIYMYICAYRYLSAKDRIRYDNRMTTFSVSSTASSSPSSSPSSPPASPEGPSLEVAERERLLLRGTLGAFLASSISFLYFSRNSLRGSSNSSKSSSICDEYSVIT